MTAVLIPPVSQTPAATLPNGPATQPQASTANPTKILGFIPGSTGLMVGVASVAGILLSNTKAAPLVFGLLLLADLDQIVAILDGKTSSQSVSNQQTQTA